MSTPSIDEIEERELGLRIRGHIDEIDEYNDKYIGHRQGYPMSRKYYLSSLSAVAFCTRDQQVIDKVANYIKGQFEKSDRPSSRKVRRNARKIVETEGHQPHEFLQVY